MRTSTAYFAGLGTVVVAVAAGLGGGYLAATIVNPHEPAVSKLERRMSTAPIAAAIAPSEPVAAPPVASPQQAGPQQAPPTQASVPQTSAKPEPQIAASNAAAPAEEKTASHTPRSVQPAPAKLTEQASEKAVERPAAPQEAFARARDADIKRAAVENRRAERRQRWDEQRRYRQPREQELQAVEEKVRELTEPRQAFADERVRPDTPRLRLFDLD